MTHAHPPFTTPIPATVATQPDYYAVLGVSPSATASDIGRAYRSKALSLHPDKQSDASDAQHASFQQLLHAYTVLSDAGRRQQNELQRQAAELSASSAARAQLWTEVQWTELDYTQPPQHHNEGDENDVRQAEEGQGEYSYVCKCGSRYVVSEAQVDRLLDEEDKDVDEIRLSCDWCSLGVRITTDER